MFHVIFLHHLGVRPLSISEPLNVEPRKGIKNIKRLHGRSNTKPGIIKPETAVLGNQPQRFRFLNRLCPPTYFQFFKKPRRMCFYRIQRYK